MLLFGSTGKRDRGEGGKEVKGGCREGRYRLAFRIGVYRLSVDW